MGDSESTSRRGRLPAGARADREEAILDAALTELVEHGADGLSMLGVARRAGASKETLYSWFGNRDGLLASLIERNADQASEGVARALADDARDPKVVLTAFASALFTLLTGPSSLALNRAAMASPDLAERLLVSGRHRVGPLVERYLAGLHASGRLDVPDPAESFELLYGLVIQDRQIRALLGETSPGPDEIARRAGVAVDRFLRLCGVPPAT